MVKHTQRAVRSTEGLDAEAAAYRVDAGNVEEWRAALDELLARQPERRGLTATELAETLGISRGRVLSALQQLRREGRLQATHEWIMAVDGSRRPRPCYRLIKHS